MLKSVLRLHKEKSVDPSGGFLFMHAKQFVICTRVTLRKYGLPAEVNGLRIIPLPAVFLFCSCLIDTVYQNALRLYSSANGI